MDKLTIQKGFYMSLCSKEEIDRIFDVKNTSDYLLKQRADATIDSTRIHRVFLKRCLAAGDEWNFNESFEEIHFQNYKNCLEMSDFEEADKITAGFVFCDDPNGRIRKTEFGNVIMVSESLRYFLYFMNLSYLHYDDIEVPEDVRNSAIKIALRTMLQSEALDFDLDPRGKIPKKLNIEVKLHTDRQLEFIIGHEYSHGFLGHLKSSKNIEVPMLSNNKQSSTNLVKIYSPTQQNEFEADIDAIERPILSPDIREDLLARALFFFAYLDVFESVKEQIFPSGFHVKTHPDPIDRFWNLYNHFKKSVELNDDNFEVILKNNNIIKESLQEDVATNIESYEIYGSIYLGSWRGKPLVDRVDY